MSFSTGPHVTVTGYLQAGKHRERKPPVHMVLTADASMKKQNKKRNIYENILDLSE